MKKMIVVLTAALPALFATPAAGSVTLGQLAPGASPVVACSPGRDYLMPEVTSGNSYVVPGTGVITSWSHNAAAGNGQTLGLKIFRHLGGTEFMAVAHDGPHPLVPSSLSLNTFAVNIPVSAGDIVGLNTGSGAATACEFDGPNYEFVDSAGPLGDGQSGPFGKSGGAFYALNISAVFQPTNTFTLGKVKRNKNGTATVTVNVPNAGELSGSGKGIKVATAAGAMIAKSVSPPTASLKIKATGKQRTQLNATGKVTVKPKITYTPTGGDPRTQSLKVKLRKG